VSKLEITIALTEEPALRALAMDIVMRRAMIVVEKEIFSHTIVWLIVSGCDIQNPDDLGLIVACEEISPMAVNGIPQFMGVQYVHKEDKEYLIDKINEFVDTLNDFEKGP